MRIWLLLLFVFIKTDISAQSIKGKIVDEEQGALAFANIMLLNPADSTFVRGTVSREDGTFTIETNNSEGLLKVSSIGFITKYVKAHQGNIGDIQMQSDTQMLGEVTVKGERPHFQTKDGSIIANVEGTVLGKIGTAEDVLAHIPGITKKQGGIEVFGKGTPIIYINGKKLQDLSELDRLNSTDIKNVELVTEPGAAYDVTINAVIKIKTIKKLGDGLGVAYRQVYSQAHQNGLQEQIDINYRHHNFDLFGSLYYGLSHGRQEQWNDQTVNGEHTLELIEDLIIKSRNEDFKGTLGFNYDINEQHFFGATFTSNTPTYSKAGWVTSMDVLRDGAKADRLLNIFSYTGRKRPTNDITAYYKGNIGKVDIDWNGEAYYRKNGNTQNSQETGETPDSERALTTHYAADSRLYASKLVLSVPVWKGNLQIGSEYTDIDRKNIYQIDAYGNNLPTSSDDKIKESNIAAFASYTFTMNKLHVVGGLRYEHVVSDYYDHDAYVAEQSKTYDNLFPHLSVSFPIKNASANLSYNIKARRPSYSILSSNTQYNNRYTYQSGNPLVQPSYLHTIAANVSYRWLRFYFNWRYTKDAFYQCVEPYEKDNEITLFTFRNLSHYQTISSGITLSPKFGCWHPMLDLSMMRQNFSAGDRDYNKPLFFLKFNNSIQLPHDFIINIDMDYMSKGHSTNIEWAETGGVNIGIYKGFFNDKFSLNVQGRDLFASYRGSNWMRYGNRDIYKWNYADTRKLVLTLRYKFNTTRSKYRGVGAGIDEKKRL